MPPRSGRRADNGGSGASSAPKARDGA
jgi:hypothetical protein